MTGLIPWRKKREPQRRPLQREFDAIYERFFQEPFFPLNEMFVESNRWRPIVDVDEDGDEISVTAEIPGMEKEDIDVSIKGRLLTIKGEKSTEKKKERKKFFKQERTYGYFERTIRLPDEVDDGSVKARYKRGVLTMKKTGQHKTKAIPITTGRTN